ncbi:MBL fold metallo-hydrolase [Profundibacterium mesophilum]|uniref:Hydroxyacylglutathione hydrolase n=1 Tax=Profundibacterium mesophilum KAUST100406-0324 TaxID=1037889 RepID=A0A921NUY7_9RHOB|nr:MBL fold metallo-hydrolase [Profundibacterium mesophilum]KAF0677149.1 hydroxyacylglutathione hydrolase [Profundibacterium mesophilum KAUST100406-0324]
MSNAVDLGGGVRCLLAPNPSPMTGPGTNSYLVGPADGGAGRLAVIDPGPDIPAHLDALRAAIGERGVSHILVTHAHLDHAPLAAALSAVSGAPVLAYGDAGAGRSAMMRRLSAGGLAGGGEGVDHAFVPDRVLSDGELVRGEGWQLEAIWTPGHFGNHMCFALGETIFSGDLVMGWASSLVSPPDGDLGRFMTSCARLAARGAARLLPGHGDPVEDPVARIEWLLAHRRAREAQIMQALAEGPATAAELTAVIYVETPPALHPAAARNVFAHLLDLHERGAVTADPEPAQNAIFTVA